MEVENPTTLVLIFIIGSLALFLLALSIFIFFVIYQKRLMAKELEVNNIKTEQQKELLRVSLLVQERERKRLAEDLHDEIGAMLSAIKINLSRFEKSAPSEASRQITAELRENLDNVIYYIRRITRSMLPPALEKFGVGKALNDMILWLNKTETFDITFQEYGDVKRFDLDREMAVFRIFQELLTNSVNYSDASSMDITFRYSDEYLCAVLQDNGIGYNISEARGKGLGLQNIEGRANAINARLKLKSKPGKGAKCILVVKLNEK